MQLPVSNIFLILNQDIADRECPLLINNCGQDCLICFMRGLLNYRNGLNERK